MSPPETAPDTPFWRRKTLEQMTLEEWESLCDGCGNCCRVKLEIPAPPNPVVGPPPSDRAPTAGAGQAEIVDTDVVCRLLDLETCRCRDYANRRRHVPTCRQLTPHAARTLGWLPETCAYRLLAHGEDLPWWHHLVSGDRETVHAAGISVRGRCLSERDVDDLDAIVEEYLEWTVED